MVVRADCRVGAVVRQLGLIDDSVDASGEYFSSTISKNSVNTTPFTSPSERAFVGGNIGFRRGVIPPPA